MRFNSYLNGHFKSCRLLATARDTHRERDVRVYQIPGEFEIVGVCDGVDAWIAPVTAGVYFRTAEGDLVETMRRLRAGEPIGPVVEMKAKPKRERLEDDISERPARRQREREVL